MNVIFLRFFSSSKHFSSSLHESGFKNERMKNEMNIVSTFGCSAQSLFNLNFVFMSVVCIENAQNTLTSMSMQFPIRMHKYSFP